MAKYKNFSDEEAELIRAFVFTNPNGKDGFVYPQPLVAGEELSPLMSAVSRTHVSMQDRTLDFLDKQKSEQTRAMIPMIRPLIEIFRLPDGTLNTSRKTTTFNKEWVILHGHGSIKEGTMAFGHCEDISDIAVKQITGHPLSHPQVKSTRYISYKKVLDRVLEDPDVRALPGADKYVEYFAGMNAKYLALIDRLADAVAGDRKTQEVVAFLRRPENVEAEVLKWADDQRKIDDDFTLTSERYDEKRAEVLKGLEAQGVRKDLAKFVLDYARVYLTAGNRTDVVFSADARTLEETITGLLSGPRIEDQAKGNALWRESKKIAPVLLGERGHIRVDEWRVKNEQELRGYCQERFGSILARNRSVSGTVNLLHPKNIEMYTDRFNAALVVFQYTDAALQDIMAELTDADVREVLAKAHEHRGKHDVLHPAIAHGGLMFEGVMGYHGYRDIYRHRRGSRTTQLLSTRLGFETPEMLKIFGMDKEYATDMQRAAELYEGARKASPHAAEKLVPFGANCRVLHSWQPNQMGYVGALRSDIQKGNLSYVYMVRELMREVGKIMPETAKYFKADSRDYPADLWKRGYAWFDEQRGKA